MSQKIKVLFRHRSMEMGGVERVLLDLLENLPRELFDITFFLTMNQGELRKSIPKDIELITLQKGREDMSSNKFLRTLQLIKRNIILTFYRNNPKILYRKIIKKDFDLEIAPTYSEFDNILSSPLNSRKIAWFHTDVSYDPNEKRVLSRVNALKKFDWVIFGSKQTRDIIKDLYEIEYPKSSVIYNSIKIDEVKVKALEFPVHYDTTPVFSSMGRLHSRKNYHTLMKVHKRLLDEGFLHSIAVIGGGSEMENLQRQAKELNIENTFLLLDSQINPYPYIKNSDYFVLPSESESYPLTIGEVMGLNIPVISTNVGGIPEMIEHDFDGYLVEPNEDAIYEGMKLFLTNTEITEKFKKNMVQSVDKFDNEKIYNQVTSVFQKQYQLKE
ncbi:glycosyltransferase [Chryseobacterium indoltheticum]|uniref:D-inositol-3-phosphate glycosyltransferase n=1 Tax=Chryseobacterium indoltheticum TaxID=254 RepID=A0A381F7G8_9FLAO|nr:glycosyltransferase [Chryseobacterium indoltheticum]SIP86978.1 Glycosyltransferase involved in cell wall bisynthesis [Chryseobacterium indoltheticum]SUX42394.1 D-inositol-3-phosphate glycosyltransferase [Chryseobacterium indoltheticum]